MAGDHPVFGHLRDFYNTVNKEASIHSRVNEEHLSKEQLDIFNQLSHDIKNRSNGVFVLLVDKDRAFSHAFNLLKTGGQFYLTDVYVERDMPAEYKENEHLWCGGAGAMRWDTLAPTVVKAGFTVPYLTQAYPVSIVHEEFKVMTEVSRLLCAGWRLFKLPDGAKRGASRVTYKGNIPGYPSAFLWDIDLTFKTGEGVDVDSELATILAFSYLSDNFDFADTTGNPTTNRNQNPFALLEKLEAEGRKPDPMYTVE
nr:hypothetical protein BaRGS_018045 [Batillaria attramentaria]